MNGILKSIFFIVLLLMNFFTLNAYGDSQSILGYWKTIDDVTNQPAAVIHVTEKNGVFSGKIVKLYEHVEAVCTTCTGERHNQPIMGMIILSGFSQSGHQWTGGKVFAVRKGKAYDGTLTLSSNNKVLQVTVKAGFVTKTETWDRVNYANE